MGLIFCKESVVIINVIITVYSLVSGTHVQRQTVSLLTSHCNLEIIFFHSARTFIWRVVWYASGVCLVYWRSLSGVLQEPVCVLQELVCVLQEPVCVLQEPVCVLQDRITY